MHQLMLNLMIKCGAIASYKISIYNFFFYRKRHRQALLKQRQRQRQTTISEIFLHIEHTHRKAHNLNMIKRRNLTKIVVYCLKSFNFS